MHVYRASAKTGQGPNEPDGSTANAIVKTTQLMVTLVMKKNEQLAKTLAYAALVSPSNLTQMPLLKAHKPKVVNRNTHPTMSISTDTVGAACAGSLRSLTSSNGSSVARHVAVTHRKSKQIAMDSAAVKSFPKKKYTRINPKKLKTRPIPKPIKISRPSTATWLERVISPVAIPRTMTFFRARGGNREQNDRRAGGMFVSF